MKNNIPFAFQVAARLPGVRPISVEILRDSGERPQPTRRGFKGEGYISEHKRFRAGSI